MSVVRINRTAPIKVIVMDVPLIAHTYGWYNDMRMVTEYKTTYHQQGNTEYKSERWFYPVQIYNEQGKVVPDNKGHNIDIIV